MTRNPEDDTNTTNLKGVATSLEAFGQNGCVMLDSSVKYTVLHFALVGMLTTKLLVFVPLVIGEVRS